MKKFKQIISILLICLLVVQQSGFAQIVAELNLAGHLGVLQNHAASDKFRPVHLRYLQLKDDGSFNLLLDKGSSSDETTNKRINESTQELFKYFLIGLALPNDTFWVNLRPDAPDNVINDDLAKTDIGRILLEADVQLKKDTAGFTSPQTPQGKLYWDRLYAKAQEIFGNTSNITIPSVVRPWIVPNEIIIRETTDSAYIYKATLKVLLEEDYLSSRSIVISPQSTEQDLKDPRFKALNQYSAQLIRELIIPKLSLKVNTSKDYAPLRQVYYSLIIAQWFKARHSGKPGDYSARIDKKDLTNLTSQAAWDKATYYNQYQQSFKQGEYNLKEFLNTSYGQAVRSYVSGGIAGIAPRMPKRGNPTTTNPMITLTQGSSPVVLGNRQEEKIVEMRMPGADVDAGGSGTFDAIARRRSSELATRLLPPDHVLQDESPDVREYYHALANAPPLLFKLLTAPNFVSCLDVLNEIIAYYDFRMYPRREDAFKKYTKLVSEDYRLAYLPFLMYEIVDFRDFNDKELQLIYEAFKILFDRAPELFEMMYGYIEKIGKRSIFDANDASCADGKVVRLSPYNLKERYQEAYQLAIVLVHEFIHVLLAQKGDIYSGGAVGEALAIKVEMEFLIFYLEPSKKFQEGMLIMQAIDNSTSASEIERELTELKNRYEEEKRVIRNWVHTEAFLRDHWGPWQDRRVENLIASLEDRQPFRLSYGLDSSWSSWNTQTVAPSASGDELKYILASKRVYPEPVMRLRELEREIREGNWLKLRGDIFVNRSSGEFRSSGDTIPNSNPSDSSVSSALETGSGAASAVVGEAGMTRREFLKRLAVGAGVAALSVFFDPVEIGADDVPSLSINNDAPINIEYLQNIIQKAGWRVVVVPKEEWENNPYFRGHPYGEGGGAVTDPAYKIISYAGFISSAGHLAHEAVHVLQSSIGDAAILNAYNELERQLRSNQEAAESFRQLRDNYLSTYNPNLIDSIKNSRELSREEKESALRLNAAHETLALIFGNLVARAEQDERSVEYASCKLDDRMIMQILEGIWANPEAKQLLVDYYIRLGIDRTKVGAIFSQLLHDNTQGSSGSSLLEGDSLEVGMVGSALLGASSAVEGEARKKVEAPGGIDFRSLPIVTQAISNLSLNMPSITLSEFSNSSPAQEWQEIEKMVDSGIKPSTDRISRYIQFSLLNGQDNDLQKVVSCIGNILRLEEESRCETEPMLKDILVVLESGRPAQELKDIFIREKSI